MKLRVLREVDTDSGQQFSSSGSTIHVATSSGEAGPSTGSISFQAFENFGCILDQRNDWQVISTTRVSHLLVQLGWVDFEFECSTVLCQILPAWADKNLAGVAEQLGKMVEQ